MGAAPLPSRWEKVACGSCRTSARLPILAQFFLRSKLPDVLYGSELRSISGVLRNSVSRVRDCFPPAAGNSLAAGTEPALAATVAFRTLESLGSLVMVLSLLAVLVSGRASLSIRP